MSSKIYETLKFIALIALPASGALYFGLASIWGFPNAEMIVGSITVIDTFLGVLLRADTKSYNKSGAKYDGTFNIEGDDEEWNLRLQNVDANALFTKSELTFKINNP